MTEIAYHPTHVRALRETFKALRTAEFPWTADTIYLNNASIGPIPERTRRALDEFTAKRTAPSCPIVSCSPASPPPGSESRN